MSTILAWAAIKKYHDKVNRRKAFFRVWDLEFQIQAPARPCSAELSAWLAGGCLPTGSSRGRENVQAVWCLLLQGHESVMTAPPSSKPNCLPRALSPNTTTIGIGL